MSLKYILLLLFFFLFQGLFSQNDLESKLPKPLTQMSYEELKDLFYENRYTDTITAKNYAKIYLNKAKKDNDTIKIAKGYKYFFFLNKDTLALEYADSITEVTKKVDNKYYPALGYLYKGNTLYKMGNDKEALENYLKGLPFTIKQKNIIQQLSIRESIGNIKYRWGVYDDALEIYKDHLNHIKQLDNYKIKYNRKYLVALHNLSIAYISNNKIDSALIYIKKGIEESLIVQDSAKYYTFLLIEGTRLFEKKEFKKSLDSINKALLFIKGNNLAICHLYKGKIYNEFKMKNESIFHLKKVDSLFQLNKHLYTELPEAYHLLAEYYKNNDDKKNQLIYLDKFLYADSLVKNNIIYLNKTINDKYDIPILISEKEQIIRELEQKKGYSSKLILILTFIGLIFLFFLLFSVFKQRIYKKRLKTLLNNNIDKPKTINKGNLIDLDKSLVNEVLKKLEEFVKKEDYLQQGISLNTLSKNFNTNSTYLSKIINSYKEKNFSNYLNDLRIDYVVNRLKNDEKFRLYTIKAISHEIGFSNPQSFANAFYKKTGIYPSYFLKQFKKS